MVNGHEPLTPAVRRWALAALGLSGAPTQGEITSAFRRRARATHPDAHLADRGQGAERAGAAEASEIQQAQPQRFVEAVQAYRLLTADARRHLHVHGRPAPNAGTSPLDVQVSDVLAVHRADRWGRPPLSAGPVRFVPAPQPPRPGECGEYRG